MLSESPLILKLACTSFTGLPQWWKLLSWSIPTLKQVCTSFTGPQQWWKMLLRSILKLKQVPTASQHKDCGETAFNIFPDTQTVLHKLHTIKTGINLASGPFLDTQTCVHELHRTSTILKTAFWFLFYTQTGVHVLHRTLTIMKNAPFRYSNCPVWVSQYFQWWKLLSRSIATHKQVCMSFPVPQQWWKMLHRCILKLK